MSGRKSASCLFLNSYDPSLVEFFFVLRSNRIHLNTAHISFFLDVSAVPLCEWFENYLGVSQMQTSPRVDVDEVPGADLLHATELVDIHDSIKLLNSDDNPGFYMETLPCSSLMQLLENARGVAHVARALLSRSPVSPRVNSRSTFLIARIGNSLDSVKELIFLL